MKETPPDVELLALNEQVLALQNAFLSVLDRYIFLRPMMDGDSVLVKRIEQERKGICFQQMRKWVYWSLILELYKLCADDARPRKPLSLVLLINKLKPDVLQKLEDAFVERAGEIDDPDSVRVAFNQAFERITKNLRLLKKSKTLESYRLVRNNVLAHTFFNDSKVGEAVFDLNSLGLKYGDEKQLIEWSKLIIEDLLFMLRSIEDCAFDHYERNERREVLRFWDLESEKN